MSVRGTSMAVTNFTLEDSSTLYGLLAESSSDIILKTDREGAIIHASPAFERFGFLSPGMLLSPRLLDLVEASHRKVVAQAYSDALQGRETGRWIEFPAITTDERQHWFEIQTRGLRDDGGKICGALSIMRSVDERRHLKDQLFAATYTDPLTKLTNRAAFISMLEHMIEEGMEGCLALFSIDFFRTINMKYGQSVGDEVLVVFADLLREMLRSEDIISRIGSERFAVLLPRTSPGQAQAICHRVVTTLADLRQKVGDSRFAITASASIAHIGDNLDSTMERAELALFCAKAKGRNRLEMEKAKPASAH